MSGLRLVGIDKAYGKSSVLENVDLEVGHGEFCALLGPSGGGKTTLLNIVAGLERPDAGRVFINDRDVTRLSPAQRDLTMVFQTYALYPNMTVAKNIGFGLKMRGTPRGEIARRVMETASLLKIENLLDRKPSQLSGGQQQRVAIGRALVRKSAIFALDEPLSNLDAALRGTMRAEIKRLHALERRTTVYVTHDQVEAMTLADRVAVLDHGRILQFDRPEVIYRRPINRRVAELVGTRAMNFVDGDCTVVNGRPCLRTQDGLWDLPEEGARAYCVEGRSVVLAFRPEHAIILAAEACEGRQARISSVETTGPDTYVTVGLVSTEISVRVDSGRAFHTDAIVKIVPDLKESSIFSSEDGQRLN